METVSIDCVGILKTIYTVTHHFAAKGGSIAAGNVQLTGIDCHPWFGEIIIW